MEWNNIAEQLNNKGPPVKDGDGWQKVWADFKFKVKKKILHNSNEIKATGGGPNQLQILSPLEEAVSDLLNYKKWLNPSGNAIGVSQPNLLQNPLPTASEPASTQIQADADIISFAEFEDEVPVQQHQTQIHETEEPALKKRRHASAFKQGRAKLLEKQCELQETTLNGINENIKNIEGHIKEVERYIRKSYKLKEDNARRDIKRLKIQEETFKIYKEEMERKEEQRKETNKIKMMDLEIKRKQIEIQEKKLALKTHINK